MIAATLLAVTLAAEPYVRSKTDPDDVTAHCLWWGTPTVTYRQNDLGNPETAGSAELDATRAAFASWQAVSDSCAHLTFVEGALTNSRSIGFLPGTRNDNIVLYRSSRCMVPNDPCWDNDSCGNRYDCWAHDSRIIALTTSTYDLRNGQLFDSDIELNAANFEFTTSDTNVATDVQNTMTHEIGHLVGLDHTSNPGSVMAATSPTGETEKRDIDSGTALFLCDVYPKNWPAQDCRTDTHTGTLGQLNAGCSAGAGGGAWALLPLIASGWLRRRQRRRGR